MKFFLFTLLFSSLAFAEITIPTLSGPVIDQTNTLSAQDINQLGQKIRQVYNQGTGPQLQVLIIQSLNDSPIEDVAEKVFKTWGIGNKQKDDGVLFIVAINDRKMRIEVGYGLEGTLTDYQSKQITSEVKKHFKKADYASGVNTGVDEILRVISQPQAVQEVIQKEPVREKTAQEKEQERDFVLFNLTLLIIFSFAYLFLKRTWRNYYLQKKEYEESEATKRRVKDELGRFKLGLEINDTKAAIVRLNHIQNKDEAELASVAKLLSQEEEKSKTSDRTKYEKQIGVLRQAQNRVDQLNAELNYLKQVVKEGK